VTDWQPIETAPTDGRRIVVYVAGTGEQFVAFRGTSIEDGDSQWIFARGMDIAFIVQNPTHWREQFEPPKMN